MTSSMTTRMNAKPPADCRLRLPDCQPCSARDASELLNEFGSKTRIQILIEISDRAVGQFSRAQMGPFW